MFVEQVVNERKQVKLIAVNTFPEKVSVSAKKVFCSITEPTLSNKAYSVLSDTTALNSG